MGETYCLPESGCFYSIYNGMLTSYIAPNEECHIPVDDLNQLDCLFLNATVFDRVKDELKGFDVNYRYKLHYDYSYIVPPMEASSYAIENFDFSKEHHFEAASRMLNQGEGDWMMPDNIRKIMREPVFDPSLWFFVKDKAEATLLGVAISTFDAEIRETDIEWFYILPQFHNRGAGRFLIGEIISRAKRRSADIRVGGTNAFYKKCGFVEKECFVWAAKQGFSFVAAPIQPNILP